MKLLAKLIVMAVIIGTTYPTMANEANSLEALVTVKEIDEGKVQLAYYGKVPEKIHVRIYDEKDKEVFKETIKSTKGVKKPYNLRQLPYGKYRFEVKIEDEVSVHNIEYKAPAFPGNVKMVARAFTKDKFKMMVMGPGYKNFKLRVYDQNNQLLFQEKIDQNENFGKVFNLNGSNARTVRLVLSNRTGILQTETITM